MTGGDNRTVVFGFFCLPRALQIVTAHSRGSWDGLGHRRSGEECCDWPKWNKLKVGLEPNQDAGINMPDYLGKVPGSLNDEKQ